MKTFNPKEHIKRVEEYVNCHFEPAEENRKVFYHYNEWCGWRFYKKAILNKDWRSIKVKLFGRK